jgi:hypothetical protein
VYLEIHGSIYTFLFLSQAQKQNSLIAKAEIKVKISSVISIGNFTRLRVKKEGAEAPSS